MVAIRQWTLYSASLCLGFVLTISGCAQNPTLNQTDATVKPHHAPQQTAATAPQQSSPPIATPQKLATRKLKKTNKKPQQSGPGSLLSVITTVQSNYPSIMLNKPFSLKYGQKRSLPDSDLNFKITKVSDSRCPMEMRCIQQGNAVVTLTLYRNEKRIDIVNVSGNSDVPLFKDQQYAYHFQLLELQPYPTVQFIELQHYVAELVITKSNRK